MKCPTTSVKAALFLAAALFAPASVTAREVSSPPADHRCASSPPPGNAYIARITPGHAIDGTRFAQTLASLDLSIGRVIAFDRAEQRIFTEAVRTRAPTWPPVGDAPVFLMLHAAANACPETVLAALRADRLFASVEPDSIHRLIRHPNDLYDGTRDVVVWRQWHLNNIVRTGLVPDFVHGSDVNAIYAWDVAIGTRETVVAIIDDGVFAGHPDLLANMWRNPGEIEGNCIDDDGDGFIDNLFGADFGTSPPPPDPDCIDDDPIPITQNSHGTMVAGVLGAVGDNGIGTTGVIQRTQMMALKVASKADGSFPVSNALRAYAYVAQERGAGTKVRVINASYGSPNFLQAESDAIDHLRKLDVVFVAAAGNDATSERFYPASYGLGNVISVAATDGGDNLSGFSNFGPSVHIAAPGERIYTTRGGGGANGYGETQGTSFAAPIVAGAVALLMDAEPALGAAEVRRRVLQSADRVPGLTAYLAPGGGRLNMARMLGVDLPSRPVVSASASCLAAYWKKPYQIVAVPPAVPPVFTRALPIAGASARLAVRGSGAEDGCFPLGFTAILPDGSERPLPDPVWSPGSVRIDLEGITSRSLPLGLRVDPPYLYRKFYGAPLHTPASAESTISLTAAFGDESALISPSAPSAPSDMPLFDRAIELGSVRRLSPIKAGAPIDGWIDLVEPDRVSWGARRRGVGLWSQQIELNDGPLIFGSKMRHLRVEVYPQTSGSPNFAYIILCDQPCTPSEYSAGHLRPSLQSSTRWFKLRIDLAFLQDRVVPPDQSIRVTQWQLLSKTVSLGGGRKRQTVVLAVSSGGGEDHGDWSPSAFKTRVESAVQMVMSDDDPNIVDFIFNRRIRDQPGNLIELRPRVRASFRRPDFLIPTPALTGSYERVTGTPDGPFYAYEEVLRFVSADEPTPSFTDVTAEKSYFIKVEGLARTGIVTGCSATAFCPEKIAQRDDAAAALARGVLGRDSLHPFAGEPLPDFTDVKDGHPLARHIGALASRSLLTGCGAKRFCPQDSLTRRELARWLSLLRFHPDAPQSAPGTAPVDIPVADPDLPMLRRVVRWGVIKPCGIDRFCPERSVTRLELAEVLEAVFYPFEVGRNYR